MTGIRRIREWVNGRVILHWYTRFRFYDESNPGNSMVIIATAINLEKI